MISHFVRAGVLAVICATSTATAATARTPYDGSWSVLIVTQNGSCDRAYRYGVQIVDGIVRYDGGAVSFSGEVAKNGAVRVTVAGGGGLANGVGRLSRNSGRGNWSGRSSSGLCTGYWEAERR
jgi:hypothetical protein